MDIEFTNGELDWVRDEIRGRFEDIVEWELRPEGLVPVFETIQNVGTYQ